MKNETILFDLYPCHQSLHSHFLISKESLLGWVEPIWDHWDRYRYGDQPEVQRDDIGEIVKVNFYALFQPLDLRGVTL